MTHDHICHTFSLEIAALMSYFIHLQVEITNPGHRNNIKDGQIHEIKTGYLAVPKLNDARLHHCLYFIVGLS